jgi:hypothetical protein
MMGRLSHDQEQFFYSFRLDEAVSDDHPVREIAAVLDLSWAHSELAPCYSRLGRSRPEAVETGRSTHVAAGSTPFGDPRIPLHTTQHLFGYAPTGPRRVWPALELIQARV